MGNSSSSTHTNESTSVPCQSLDPSKSPLLQTPVQIFITVLLKILEKQRTGMPVAVLWRGYEWIDVTWPFGGKFKCQIGLDWTWKIELEKDSPVQSNSPVPAVPARPGTNEYIYLSSQNKNRKREGPELEMEMAQRKGKRFWRKV